MMSSEWMFVQNNAYIWSAYETYAGIFFLHSELQH